MSKSRSKGLSALRPRVQQDTGAGTPSAGVSPPVADGEASGSHQQPCKWGSDHPACSRNGGPYACSACIPELRHFGYANARVINDD